MMKLTRPLTWLDLETTGVNVQTDRIVEIAVRRIHPDPDVAVQALSSLINPMIPIPPGATAVHGITDADVADAPTFATVADAYGNLLDGDLAGYNCRRFDIPLLAREFERVGVIWGPGTPFWTPDRRILDVYQLWLRLEPRDLKAAIRRFAPAWLASAEQVGGLHRAMMDVHGTGAAALGMIAEFFPDGIDVAGLEAASRDPSWIDADGQLRWQDGKAVLSFGKHAGRPLQDVPTDYFRWMVGANFSREVLDIVRAALRGSFPEPPTLPTDTDCGRV